MDAMIIEATRTPRARSGETGQLAKVTPIQLLDTLYNDMKQRQPEAMEQVESVTLGCVGGLNEQGSNIAKVSAVYSQLPHDLTGATLNSFCASGLDAIMVAASRVAAWGEGLALCGGVEHLSRVPMFADSGPWFAEQAVADRTGYVPMGVAADLLALREGFAREKLDDYGFRSYERARFAQTEGYFKPWIIPIDSQNQRVALDDGPIKERPRSYWDTKQPAFKPTPAEQRRLAAALDGRAYCSLHHSATSPMLVDGASLLLLANEATCERLNLQPLARIKGAAGGGGDPVEMLTGHLSAAKKLLARHDLTPRDIDVYEINESFAASVLKFQQDLELDPNACNRHGGALALGHPLGATGGILVGQLCHELQRTQEKLGLAAIPGGAGLGAATLIERV